MFDGGCHDNDTSNAPNMAFFVHSPKKPTTTQKNSGGLQKFISNFAPLSQRIPLKYIRVIGSVWVY